MARSRSLLAGADGFTLVELLVVILIIGILIAVAGPTFLGQTKKAYDSQAKQELAVGYQVAKSYAVDHDGFGSPTAIKDEIESNEPELRPVGVGSSVSDVASEKQLYVLNATDGGDLELAYKSRSGAMCTLQVTGNGAPVIGCLPGTPTGDPSPSGGSSQGATLAYVRDHGIWTERADGTGAATLIDYAATTGMWPGLLQWSPDSSELWMVGTYDGSAESELRKVAADGSGDTLVRHFTCMIASPPSFTPDGSKVYFDCGDDAGPAVYSMNSDGTNVSKIVDGASWPQVSPDGTRLVWTMPCGGDNCLEVSALDGSNAQIVYSVQAGPVNPGGIVQPSWSPDGSHLVFVYQPYGGDAGGTSQQIEVVGVDGSNATTLVPPTQLISPGNVGFGNPHYSPDGSTVVFNVMADRERVFSVPASGTTATDGSGLTALSPADPDHDYYDPAWRPM